MKLDGLHRSGKGTSSRERLLVLFGCLLLGVLLGQWAHDAFCTGGQTQIQEYLMGYARVCADDHEPSWWTIAWVYVRYPLAAFLLGFTALGVFLLPVLVLAQGCLLSFSVACFAAAMARGGVLLALAALGVRCLVTLPCLLLLADRAWEKSRGLPQGDEARDGVYILRFLLCLLLLLLGTVLERTIVPELVALALAGVS